MLGIACLHDSHKTSYKLDCLQLSHLNFPLPALAQRDSTQRGNRLHRGGRKAPLLQMAETVMWIFQWKHDVVLGQIHETKKTCERKNPAANQMQQRRDTKCLAPTVLLTTQEKHTKHKKSSIPRSHWNTWFQWGVFQRAQCRAVLMRRWKVWRPMPWCQCPPRWGLENVWVPNGCFRK